ncbi:MAG TPA: hypothetical protein VGF33_08145, partial [Caulobacteraceae bacterium]
MARILAGWLAANLVALFALGAAATTVDIIPRPQHTEAGAGGAVLVRSGTPIVVSARDASAISTAHWLAELALKSRGLRLVPTT